MRPSTTTNPLHLIELGFAILVMSSSGTLGRMIDLPTPLTIWIRSIIALTALGLILRLGKKRLWPESSQLIVLASAVFLGAHWITYFVALSYSSVAVGMLCMFTYPLMTALLEPFVLHIPFRIRHVLLSAIALVGIFLLVPEFSLSNTMTIGILFALLSALVYSFRNLLVKKGISKIDGVSFMFYQVVIITVMLLPAAFYYPVDFHRDILQDNGIPLLLLGLATTATGHTLFVRSFRYFSTTTVSILSNLTPVFGTVLGLLVLDEVPGPYVIAGGSLILLTSIAEAILAIRE